jgi:ribonuclease PH
MAARKDGREPGQLRELRFIRDFTEAALGSVLVEMGRTRVMCTASLVDHVPPFLLGQRRGWLTAEYAMLPASSGQRKPRERGGRVDGRSTEIQRLIGRCLRSVVDMKAIPEKTIYLDCDVLQADGGTRTAAINGAFVALYDALRKLDAERKVRFFPIQRGVAAVSVGVVEGEVVLDMCYEEDSRADVDMNLVMTSTSEFLEIQGTGEQAPFDEGAFEAMLAFGKDGIAQILEAQREVLGVDAIV